MVEAMTLALATNHAGWHVQFLADYGWESAWHGNPGVFEDRSVADGVCYDLKRTHPAYEFRVYEALKEDKK